MSDRDPFGLAFIDAYIGVFVDSWGCKIDHDDGSTAPFSALAAEQADRLSDDLAECLQVATE